MAEWSWQSNHGDFFSWKETDRTWLGSVAGISFIFLHSLLLCLPSHISTLCSTIAFPLALSELFLLAAMSVTALWRIEDTGLVSRHVATGDLLSDFITYPHHPQGKREEHSSPPPFQCLPGRTGWLSWPCWWICCLGCCLRLSLWTLRHCNWLGHPCEAPTRHFFCHFFMCSWSLQRCSRRCAGETGRNDTQVPALTEPI